MKMAATYKYKIDAVVMLNSLYAQHGEALFPLIEDTFAAAEGDSNDAEIEALQAARDRLAALIDYTPAHERDWTPHDAA